MTSKIACILIVIVGVLLGMPPVGASAQPDPLDDLFARGRAVQAGITTLTAAFTETTVSTLLRDPLVATGSLVSALPVRVVMHYTSPSVKTVALDDTRLVVVWPGRPNEVINISETQRRVRKYFVDASPGQLRETFTIALSSDVALNNAYRLDLSPKRKQVAEGLQHLRIWIDRTRLLMIKMSMDYPAGESKTFELRDIRTNVVLDESEFALLARRG